jgi:outer membrane autotransporter protein
MESRCYQRSSALILALSGIIVCLFVLAPRAWASDHSDLNAGPVTANDNLRTGAQQKNKAISGHISSQIAPRPSSPAHASYQSSKQVREAVVFDSDPVTAAMIGDDGMVGMNIPDNMTGLSSGGKGSPLCFWASATASSLRNDLISTKYDGHLYLMLAGLDYRVNKNLLLGMAIGYEWTELDTVFNNGNMESDGFTISPYVAYLINDSFSIDLLVSYSDLDYDTERTFTGVYGDYDADRFMVSSNLNYYYVTGNWCLNARLGYMYTEEDADGFTETDGTRIRQNDTDLGEIRFGGQASYFINDFELFFAASYHYDTTMDRTRVGANMERPSNDKDEFETTFGVNVLANDTFQFGAEVSTIFGRDDVENTSVLMNLRIMF